MKKATAQHVVPATTVMVVAILFSFAFGGVFSLWMYQLDIKKEIKICRQNAYSYEKCSEIYGWKIFGEGE